MTKTRETVRDKDVTHAGKNMSIKALRTRQCQTQWWKSCHIKPTDLNAALSYRTGRVGLLARTQ